ncbi:hypothetical protein LCGC14_1078040 [marine sediment metagenome]|uniref:DUF5131 family protein n=1 Tax=marine sediment metagenome TaxID=412755 RepID=A0A0F9N3N6_9ZZZZ
MHRSKIEWCQNPDGSLGWVWNPVTGCLNNCSYCYARRLANTRLRGRYLANDTVAISLESPLPNPASSLGSAMNLRKALDDPFYPRFWESRLHDRGLFQDKPRGIFTCDMSDLFGIGVPETWTDRVMDNIKAHRQHRFYLLTKQPQNLPKSPSYFPDNCWVGVSATDTDMAVEGLSVLNDIEAKIKYLSIEPLLSYIPLTNNALQGLQWVIIGACTGTKEELLPLHHKTGLMMMKLNGNRWSLQPQVEWVQEIVEACDKAEIPVLLKDSLKPLMGGYPIPIGNMWAYKFERGNFKLRQEIPQ